MARDAIAESLWPHLSALIGETTGLHFPPERRDDLRRGLTEAAVEFGFSDSAACANWLLSSQLTPAQIRALASHLTIGETYFFRERKTFDVLQQKILPELISARRGRDQRLRLWSAACSTGEEAYSLAILLHELLPDWNDWNVTLLATDINARFLQKAVAAVYGEWSFRDCPVSFKDRYFTRTHDQRFALKPQIARRVKFAQLNLAEDTFPSLTNDTNAMDVILCRNAIIYFTPQCARRLAENLHHALRDGGWLSVSPSECSQTLFKSFATQNFPGAVLYRKTTAITGVQTEALPAWDAQSRTENTVHSRSPQPTGTPQTAIDPVVAAPRPRITASLRTAQEQYDRGRYVEAAETLTAFITAEPSMPGTDTERSSAFSLLARALANTGDLAAALRWSARWIEADKVDPAAHYLHAMASQELGDRATARQSLQRSLYLRPDFALAHFALANCARSEGRSAEAQRHDANALAILRVRPPEEIVPESDGLTAGRLAEMIAALSTPASAAAVPPASRALQ